MEIGLNNEDTGINYFDLFYGVKGTKEQVGSKEAEISFFIWFLQNFHNAEDRHHKDADLILEYRIWLIRGAAASKYHNFDGLKLEYKNYLNSQWFLNGNAAKQYLDYLELKEARITATQARKQSNVSILIAIGAMVASVILGAYSISSSPEPPFDVKIIENNVDTDNLKKENEQLKEKLYKAEMMVRVLEEKS